MFAMVFPQIKTTLAPITACLFLAQLPAEDNTALDKLFITF